MAKLITFQCPVCGKNLTASSVEQETRCVHCGNLLHLTTTLDQVEGVQITAVSMDTQSAQSKLSTLNQRADHELPGRQKQRFPRLRPDPDAKKIPPMIFSQPRPIRPDGRAEIVLYKLPPMPLVPPPGSIISIIEQIDEVLQEIIAGTPLENRDIHLLQDPLVGVVVRVGPQHFRSVDAISDPEVKAAIKAAVAQWEKEQ